jgi:6-phosphogluconolactonase
MSASTRPDAGAKVIAVKDADALAATAARRLLDRLLSRGGSDRLAVCLAGGSTPEGLYRLLAAYPWRDAMPWDRITWFWGDERLVPASDVRSNAGMVRRVMLDHVPAAAANIVPIPTDAANATEAAARYETLLKRHYGGDRLDPARPLFDVVLLGLGTDGHTASLFPGQASLQETSRWVVGVPEAGVAPFVPRVTLTFPALASTREMLFLVAGANKREVASRVLSEARDGAPDPLPAARARADGDLVWLVEQAAMPPAPERAAAPGTDPSAGPDGRPPTAIVVMGVSGSGKSTIGAMLAHFLGFCFEDGDWFHPPANIAKMTSHHPLDDDDRRGWLEAIARWIAATRADGGHGVIACSALKHAYRDLLRAGHDDVRFVYLKGDRDLIANRFAMRHQHFMPVTLLDSQFAILEEPAPEEHAIIVSIDAHPRDIVAGVVAALGLGPTAVPRPGPD